MTFDLNINGRQFRVDAEADTPLLWVLRDELNLTGTKYGCGQALCGACIRLSDKTSRLRPRHVVPKPAQTYEPEVPVEVREWIAPAPPDFVLEAQPPAQPHRRVSIERSIRLAD